MNIRPSLLNDYHVWDARRIGELLGSQTIDVTITSPPYWDLKDYGAEKQIGFGQSLPAYLEDLKSVFDAVWERTSPSGSLWVVLDSLKKNGAVHLLPFELVQRLTAESKSRWHLQDILIWHKPHTLPWSHSGKLRGHFEYILCFSKSKRLTLNLDSVRTTSGLANWWVKYPERYHPLGKSISNVWEYSIPTQGTWGNGLAHFCPLPIDMIQRIILLSTKGKSDVVLDPFAGTGPVLLAAHGLGRKWIGSDLHQPSRAVFFRRLAQELPARTERSDRGAFSATNLDLRQLKYAVQIYKLVAPSQRLTTADVPVLVVRSGKQQSSPAPAWVTQCVVYVVVADALPPKRLQSLRKAIDSAQTNPPLSKYQLEVEVVLVRRSRLAPILKTLGKAKLYRYTQGHFWRATETTVTSGTLIRKRIVRLPDVVSNLHVDERPAY